MRNQMRLVLLIVIFFVNPLRAAEPVKISARNPEVLASYADAAEMRAQLKSLSPKLQRVCGDLLETQLRMHNETDNWKMYSLYEVFEREALMTGPLQRVPTITELASAIPKYTAYRPMKTKQVPVPALLKNGSILIADKGVACGPDPLALTKGAYFMKCGAYLIGSGLMKTQALAVKSCKDVRVLVNADLE